MQAVLDWLEGRAEQGARRARREGRLDSGMQHVLTAMLSGRPLDAEYALACERLRRAGLLRARFSRGRWLLTLTWRGAWRAIGAARI